MQRVLITGGAGFIGSKLVKKLLAENKSEIAIVDNLHPQVHGPNATLSVDLQHRNVSFFKVDITDALSLTEVVKNFRPQLVIHLASETGTGQSHDEIIRYNQVNVLGTAILLSALKQHAPDLKKIILSSSRAVYGEGPWLTKDLRRVIPKTRSLEDMKAGQFEPRLDYEILKKPLASKEDDGVSPVSIYAATKLHQEYLINQYLTGSDVKAVLFRFQNVYGPGQSLKNPYTGVLSIFSTQILSGKKLNIFEDGDIVRDFVFVDDVVDAIFRSLYHDLPHGIILNVGSGQATTILDAAKILLELYNQPINHYTISGDFRIGDIRHALSDNTIITKFLGWSPTTELHQGLSLLTQSVKPSSIRS